MALVRASYQPNLYFEGEFFHIYDFIRSLFCLSRKDISEMVIGNAETKD